jgi:threonine/homoserine/homoserine lactone efflux protein
VRIFLSGIITGFSVAAPIGPISLLCVNHALARGALYGFFTSLGASTADTIYGLIAGLGLTMVVDLSGRYHEPIRMAGGLLLVGIGLYQLFAGSRRHAAKECSSESVLKGYAVVFTSTLANPFTVCFFLSVFSAFAGKTAHAYQRALEYAAGIFVGTAFWWFILNFSVGLLQKTISPGTVSLIRRLSALLIAALGVYALVR